MSARSTWVYPGVFKVGIKNHLIVHFVSNLAEEAWKNKARQRERKKQRERESERARKRPPANYEEIKVLHIA